MGEATQSLKHVDVEVLRNGKQLSRNQQDMLTSQVTGKEIEEALKGIGNNKAPGVMAIMPNSLKLLRLW